MFSPVRLAKVSVAAIVVAAIVGASVPASAAPVTTPAAVRSSITQQQLHDLESAVDFPSHEFDAGIARSHGVPESDIYDYATGYLAGGGRVEGIEVSAVDVSALGPLISLRSCSGRNGSDVTFLQKNLYMNSCVTNNIIGKIGTGAGIAAIAAAITAGTGVGGVVAGIIAGILGVGAGLLTSCASKGRGVVIHQITATAVTWCTGQ